jgi:hypothetical protein
MTYPPQGPYGQQPDPYGQQQPDPYAQQQPQYGGGYQQQQPAAGQYGGYDPNAQYGGGYQQYGGVGGPPPKSNKGPIIAIVSIVVLILAGVGVTGFVAPGFFLSDDKENTNAGGDKTTGGDDAAGADGFVKKLVAAADDKDKSALQGMQCKDATSAVEGATNSIDEISGAELKDSKEVSDKEVTVTMTITVDGSADDYEATVVKDGAEWCWKDISGGSGGSSEESTDTSTPDTDTSAPPTGGGNTDAASAPGIQFIGSFLEKVNGGDAAGAKAMLCSDSSDATTIDEVGPQSPQISINFNGEVVVEEGHVTADLTAVLNGEETTGWATAFEEDAGWCVYIFSTY